MKIMGTLLIICLVSRSNNTFGQNLSRAIFFANIIPGKIAVNEKPGLTTGSISSQKITNTGKLTTPVFQGNFFALNFSKCNSFTTGNFHSNSNKNSTYSGLPLTGLVMVAAGISHFINFLKNKNNAGLNLACQKTSFGASNKACKKVTGITFSIPIRK